MYVGQLTVQICRQGCLYFSQPKLIDQYLVQSVSPDGRYVFWLISQFKSMFVSQCKR